jgi:RNA polymerase sigma-70 factor, ECF subfamily
MKDITTSASASDEIERLYRDQSSHLWRALLAFTRSQEIANDAMSEAYAQLLRRKDDVAYPARWVWRAAFKIAAGQLAERASFTDARSDAAEDAGLETSESSQDLLEALAKLPPRERGAVTLFYLADLDTTEVARILGMRPATVRVHLHRGRNRLRTLLEDTDD